MRHGGRLADLALASYQRRLHGQSSGHTTAFVVVIGRPCSSRLFLSSENGESLANYRPSDVTRESGDSQ